MDGPFTETREGIGGYYKILAESLEDALELARACPVLAYGCQVLVAEVDLDYCEARAALRRQWATELLDASSGSL